MSSGVALAPFERMMQDRSFRPHGEQPVASSAVRVCRSLHTAGRHRLPVVVLASSLLFAACQRPVRSSAPTPPNQAQLAQLWVEPRNTRDLYWGVGGKALAPDPTAPYTVIAIKRDGFSRGYTVTGPGDREWSVKFPPEAPTEVVASRIHWGIGYHQPPLYYVTRWTAVKATSPNPQLPARFREKNPKLSGKVPLSDEGSWSYYENPFVGTRELKGLLVLQAMLGNSDLKDGNNALYKLPAAVDGARIWYVARDLGHTFGRTGVLDAPRGDVEVFEETPFITGVGNGLVKFDWRGRHDTLFDDITPADVRWISGRLQRLSDQQWQDAFRAGGYVKSDADRFIRRLKQKIAEGLALKG
jgi:hypothetical protein